MNAAAYLQKQGWRGHGHSLDESNRGLARPLLVTHKTDSAGLGKKQNNFADQWWLKAWDSKPEGASAEQPKSSAKLNSILGRSALYSHFVKSTPLAGTVGEDRMATEKDAPVSNGNGHAATTPKPPKKDKPKKRSYDESPDATSEKQDRKEKKHKRSKENTVDGVKGPAEAPSNLFFVDTVGGGDETPANTLKKAKPWQRKEKHPDKKRIFEASSVKREDYSKTKTNGTTSYMHPDRLALANGTGQSGPASQPTAHQPTSHNYKVPQTAFFPDTSVSIGEMVRRHNEEMKKPGPDGKIPKRRAPRNIRKDARAAKQAALDAQAAAEGKIAAPVSKPMTKSERRHERKHPKPMTDRKKLKLERKLRKQERAKQGALERKQIENEALRMVEEMKASGTMPDISKPMEEILAEKQAELTADRETEKVKEAAKAALERIKEKGRMPLDKTEDQVLAEQEQRIREWNEGLAKAQAEGKSWPPPRPKKDFSDVELPELDVPKFRTVTMGIPIPGTKKRGSLKQLRAALVSAGLTQQQQAAYIAKALEDKKEARRIKDEKRTEKRIGRKQARARKKLKIQQGLAARKKTKKEKEAERALTDPKLALKQKKKAAKAETLSHNTTIMLQKREAEMRERGEEYTPPNKTEVKQARRAARKVVRLAKKGRLTREDVPDQFKLKRSQKLKLRGNGGRIPDWTAMDIAENIRTAQEDAIKAAEKSNKASHPSNGIGRGSEKNVEDAKQAKKERKERKAKAKKADADGFTNGDGYIPL